MAGGEELDKLEVELQKWIELVKQTNLFHKA